MTEATAYRSPSADLPARITNRATGEVRTTTMEAAAAIAGIDTDDAAWAIEEEGRADATDDQGTDWTIRAA